jgi:hypothetical protein
LLLLCKKYARSAIRIFDELAGFIPVRRVYFGVTILGLSLRLINQVTGLTHYHK